MSVKIPFILLCLCAALFNEESAGQQRPNSPVFRDYRPPGPTTIVEQTDVTYQMWQTFRLMQKANAGDAVAQQELSLRYLTGRGVKADTTRGAWWAEKAALNGMIAARYNLGILQYNGWGVSWNPFESFRSFLYAAERGMTEAQYVLGQFYTDNLVVPRDWVKAYRWTKAAADSGFEPARSLLSTLEKHVHISTGADSATARVPASGTPSQTFLSPAPPSHNTLGLIYLELGEDTAAHVDDLALLKEALREGNIETRSALPLDQGFDAEQPLDSISFTSLLRVADAGNPEALVVVGRWHEKGNRLQRDPILAAMQYIRAARLESPRAGAMLWSLIQSDTFFDRLKGQVEAERAAAEYVWAGLTALGFDRQLTDGQALRLLEGAGERGFLQADVELGLCYYAGRWVRQDHRRALRLWRRAAAGGSIEAKLRIIVAQLTGSTNGDIDAVSMRTVEQAVNEGSILAQVALAFCSESGKGGLQNKGLAAKLYRAAASRGSVDAFNALRRMHDQIRPPETEYQLRE